MGRIGNNLTYLIDTHAIYWFFFEPEKFPEKIKEIITSKNFAVSTIILAELSNLLDRKEAAESVQQKIWEFLDNKKIRKISFDYKIFQEFIKQNKELDIHDRIIVSTAKLNNVYLVSKDRMIREHYSKTIWQ